MIGDVGSPLQLEGAVSDRPLGLTLAALGLGGRTGQITVTQRDSAYRIAFVRGAIVGATSPLPADSLVRVALTTRLVTAAQVGELTRKIYSAPAKDELKVLAEAASLTPEQARGLRRRVIIQRASRAFALEQGVLRFDEQIEIPITVEVEVDVRAVIYAGARYNLAAPRLAIELRQLGSRFVLRPEAEPLLERFDLPAEEVPVVEALRGGTSAAELEAVARELDPRSIQAVIYALACCGALAPCDPPRAAAMSNALTDTSELSVARTPTPREPTLTRTPTPREPTLTRTPTPREPTVSRTPTPREPTVSRTPTPRDSTVAGTTAGTTARAGRISYAPITRREAITVPAVVVSRAQTRGVTESFAEVRATTVRPNPLAKAEIESLIATRCELLDRGADHFALLGVPFGAHADAVRAAYVELARYLRPEKLAELRIVDHEFDARRLFAQVCIAFTVLTDPVRRADYLRTLRAATEPGPLDKKSLAREAYRRGELLLRADEPQKAVRELKKCCELDPHDVDAFALLGWATFCAASDKSIVASETRRALERAIYKSSRPEVAWFYLGRVERMLGRDSTALHHFREVLKLDPKHADAAAEIRVLEVRLGGAKTSRTR